MEAYLQENFGGVQAKHSPDEALARWRRVVGVVKNPKRRFRFTANLDERSEATKMKHNNHERLRVAVHVSKAALQYIHGIAPSSEYKVPADVKAAGFGICAEELSRCGSGIEMETYLQETSGGELALWRAVVGVLNKYTPRANVQGILVRCTPPTDQIEEQRKRCAAYSEKALVFAITTFLAYLGSSSSTTGHTSFKIAMAAFFLAGSTDFISVKRAPKWGSLLTYLSCFLLVLVLCLLFISFNKAYAYALLPVPLPIAISLLRARQLRSRNIKADDRDGEADQQDVITEDDQAAHALITKNKADDEDLDGIFNVSALIVSFDGLINIGMGVGHYVVGPNKDIAVSPVGFLFFFTVVLGLYLMMVTTVRNAALTLHASQFAYLLQALLLGTLGATAIWGIPRPANG